MDLIAHHNRYSRHRRPDRRKADPLWEEICYSFLKDLPETGRVRQRSASSGPDLKRARTTALTNMIQTAAWEKLQGLNPYPSPEEYLGSVFLQYLSGWLKAKGFESFEEAVDFKVMELVSSGKAL